MSLHLRLLRNRINAACARIRARIIWHRAKLTVRRQIRTMTDVELIAEARQFGCDSRVDMFYWLHEQWCAGSITEKQWRDAVKRLDLIGD